MNDKILKRLKFLEIFLFFLIFIEVIHVCYSLFFNMEKDLYFDGVNAIDKNSNYYVTVGSNNSNVNHYEKAKVSAYDSKRNKKFEKLYNVGYNSAFFGVAFDDDDIIAVGNYEKTADEHSNLQRRALIVKYNMSGEIIFQKDFQILDNSKFTSIYIVDDGYLVTGQSVYQNTKIGNKKGGAVLLKYDKDGNILWSKTYGDNKFGSFNDLLVSEGFIYTVGINKGNSVICKFDMEGNLCGYDDYNSGTDFGFNSIVVLNDKLYVSSSKRNGSRNFAVIVMYDFDCNYINEVLFNSKNDTCYNRLMIDSHGYIVAIGTVSVKGDFSNKMMDGFHYGGIIGKYKANLEKVSVVTYEYNQNDLFTDIINNNGEYLVVGYSLYNDVYLSKFIRYSEALKVLDVES